MIEKGRLGCRQEQRRPYVPRDENLLSPYRAVTYYTRQAMFHRSQLTIIAVFAIVLSAQETRLYDFTPTTLEGTLLTMVKKHSRNKRTFYMLCLFKTDGGCTARGQHKRTKLAH
jgi:hypothetical protein